MAKREVFKILLIFALLLIPSVCLYYYFFIKLDTDWMFWKKNGEDIDWSSIEYDDDFYPKDTVEVYGEYGEWKIKEFKPIYAGYGTTEDGLDYLIGKYLDEDGEEQTVKILVSGEGMSEWMFPDSGFTEFYNNYYKDNVAIRGGNWDPERIAYISNMKYSSKDTFIPIPADQSYICPENTLLTKEEVSEYMEVSDDLYDYYFVQKDVYDTYCNNYIMFYNANGYTNILHSFTFLIEQLEIGDQFSVRYLESSKTFEECQYDYSDYQKILCANEYLNEIYGDDFLVGIYIELD